MTIGCSTATTFRGGTLYAGAAVLVMSTRGRVVALRRSFP
jgi:uncharacterized protein (TIGR03382 family)